MTRDDRHNINISIHLYPNLPHIHTFLYTATKKVYRSQYANSTVLRNKLCKLHDQKPAHLDQYELKFAVHYCSFVVDKKNQHLNSTQKELLRWGQKLCHNMQYLQQFMKTQNVRDKKSNILTTQPPIIKTKFKSTPNLKCSRYPLCFVCKLAQGGSIPKVSTEPTKHFLRGI